MDGAPDDGVVVDVVFESGLLYLELANLGVRPALQVSCAFEPPLTDSHGRDVSKLQLFRRVEYLGPGRAIRTLLDSSAGYFARQAPLKVKVTTRYKRPGGAAQSTTIAHDLAVFRDLSYV
jgi:hypothetical protein